MKYIYRQIFFLGLLFATFIACNEKEIGEANLPLSLEKETIAAANIGLMQEFNISVTGKWTASTEYSWIKLSPATGENSTTCELTVDSSVLNEARTGSVRFSVPATGEVKTLRITQMGFDKQVVLSVADTTLSSTTTKADRYFTMNVTTNVDLSHSIVDALSEDTLPAKVNWISIDNADEVDVEATGARPQTIALRFDFENNVDPMVRAARVIFNSAELSEPVSLLVNQKAGPKITDDAAGDSLTLLILQDKLVPTSKWNESEPMSYWNNVTLWAKTDSLVKKNPEMLGRVRSLIIRYIRTKESIPVEIGNLKYLEALYVGTNASTSGLDIDLSQAEDGIGKLENLEELIIFGYGLVGELPESWKNLKKLKYLSLSANNFATIPILLTPENFPSLTHLNLTANLRYSSARLNPLSAPLDKIGLHHYGSDELFKNLLRWNTLEYLSLNNVVLEGQIPTAEELGITEYYTENDKDTWGDTINYLIEKNMPKVLPNMKSLRLNLNFLNGEIPDWILYHPRLPYWDPWSLVYNQRGYDNTAGEPSVFTNKPINWDYYWEVFPLLKPTRD